MGEARWVPPCLLTLSLSPLPMSAPFSSIPTDCPIWSLLSLSSPWSASVHLPVSCRLSSCVLVSNPLVSTVSLLPSVSHLLPPPLPVSVSVSLSISYPFCLFLSCFPLSWVPLSAGPSACTRISSLPPVFLPFPPPPGYEKSRSLSSIAGLSGVSLRLAPLATPPGSPRAARRAPPTLPSIL